MTDHAERLVGADHLQFEWQARAEAAEAEVELLRKALARLGRDGRKRPPLPRVRARLRTCAAPKNTKPPPDRGGGLGTPGQF